MGEVGSVDCAEDRKDAFSEAERKKKDPIYTKLIDSFLNTGQYYVNGHVYIENIMNSRKIS